MMIQRVYHGIPSTNPKKYFPWRFCGQPDVRIIIPVTFKGVMQYTNPFCFLKQNHGPQKRADWGWFTVFLVIGWLMRDDWFTIASLILIGWLFGLLG
jgi:hypothetical protein